MDILKNDGSGWNESLIKEICTEELAFAIMSNYWPAIPDEDILCWNGSDLGSFTMENCFEINIANGSAELPRFGRFKFMKD